MSIPTYEPPSTVKPRLWRSSRHKVIAGVCGGLAEKLNIDPTTFRLVYVALSIFSGAFPGTLVYIVLWMITREHDVVAAEPRAW